MTDGKLCLILTLTALLAVSTTAGADHVDYTATFSQQDLAVTKYGGYDVLTLRGCDVSREVGRPQLPVLSLTLVLPGGARATDLEVLGAETRDLLERFDPLPAQAPRILPIPGLDPPDWRFSEPDASVYRSGAPYPPVSAEIVSEGRLGGNVAVGVAVHPLQFIPDTGKIRLFRRIDLRLHYESSGRPVDARHERVALRRFADAVADNAGDVSRPVAGTAQIDSRLDPGDHEYVIITDAGYVSSFQPLADWKTRKGVPAVIVTVDWIESNYEGDDTQSRVRGFIIDAYQSWGASWFLLGGDTQVIPARRAYAMTCDAGMHPEEDAIGCDLYYADLDGDWDLDGDGVYGEIEDDVDLYPDVFVGRASVRTVADVQAFVNKVVSYERDPVPGAGLDMLMAAEVLWTDPFTDSGIALNVIDRENVPPRYDPITKLYETLGNETTATVTSALNAGKSHFLHSGHAWFTVIGCGDGYMDRTDADGLSNGTRAPVAYSIGCWPAAFDLETETCIAEHFLRNPDGGVVAFIGNSRYGWGSPGNPGYGYSERFMQGFYRALFGAGRGNLAAALAVAKAELVPFSRAENVYRWHQYELNLLGDPEMPVWTNEPEILGVSHPDSVVAGSSSFDVSVWTAQGPVEGALVCLDNGSGVYGRAETGADGSAVLAIEAATPESISVTVTARDCRPYEAGVRVNMTGAYVRVADAIVDDLSGGNGDGLAGPGEIVNLSVPLRNFGTDGAVDVEAVLSTGDSFVQISSGNASYGHISAGAEASSATPFTFEIGATCPDRHVVLLDLTVSESGVRTTWNGAVAVTVAAPVLSIDSHAVDDATGGDSDGTPEPGESFRLMVEVRNSGLATAVSPEVTLSSSDVSVTLSDAEAFPGDVPAGETRQCVFALELSPTCTVPHFVPLDLSMMTLDGTSLADRFTLAVGHAGLSEDFEGGAPEWTHAGTNDLWTLTDHRYHSGSTSWYAGSESTWEYQNDMAASLTSPEFVIGIDAWLSFWCWHEFPTYHEDGFYVELLSGGTPVDTLDFIGSGGALDHLGTIGNEWLEYAYPIERTAGETLRVRFFFASDEVDVAEGVYVDDVMVTSNAGPDDTGIEAPDDGLEIPVILHQNRPNPFAPSTMIGFSMNTRGSVVLSIYNIQGRFIRTLIDDFRGPGEHAVVWDGQDEFGVDVAAGVYMYRLTFGEYEDTRKMILVR